MQVGRDLWRTSSVIPDQSRSSYSKLLRNSSRWVLNISKYGNATAFFKQPVPVFGHIQGKIFFHVSKNSSLSILQQKTTVAR